MALIECPECGKVYSNKADKCPVCACPTNLAQEEISSDKAPKNPKPRKKHTGRNVLIVLFILILAGGVGYYAYENHMWEKESKLSDEERARLDSIFIADSIKAAIENAKEDIAIELENCTPTQTVYFLKIKKNMAFTSANGDSVRFLRGDVLSRNIRKNADGTFHYKTADSLEIPLPQGSYAMREYETAEIPANILDKYILLFKASQYGNTITARKKRMSSSIYALSYGTEEILAESRIGKVNFHKYSKDPAAPIFVPSQRAFVYGEEFYYLEEIIPIDENE